MAVVAITRQAGSQGDALGEHVAARLGYDLVRRTDLLRLAADVGGPDAWDQSPELRERNPSFWERLNDDRQRHVGVLRSVVVQLAERDRVVIVGLGAGQLLGQLHQVLRLLVVAPPNVRLAQVMATGFEDTPGPLSREQAQELVRRRDRETIGYMRYLFHIDWLEPHYWDLVINTGRFDVAQASELIASIVEGGLVEPRAVDRQRLGNMALACRVESTLLRDPTIWINGLKVRADDGHVTIEGEVMADEDADPIETAEAVALTVPGVTSVTAELRLQPPPRLTF